MLSVAYGAGLSASEVVSLKIADIDSRRMIIRFEHRKRTLRRCHVYEHTSCFKPHRGRAIGHLLIGVQGR